MMTFMKLTLYTTNLLEEAIGLYMQTVAFPGKYQWNQYYYTMSTYNNLALAIPWITESLQTMNTNVASGIDQSTDFVAGLIGTPQNNRRLGDSDTSRGNTLFQRLDNIDDQLGLMSNDIEEISDAIGSGTQKPNRGKSGKKSKKKKNMFDQAKVEEEGHEWPGRDRLLRTSLVKQIEAKIDSQNEKIGRIDEKIGRLEDKLDKVAASQNEKIDKVAASQNEKMDRLETLMMQLLDVAQQE